MSEPYLLAKTMDIMVHKDAVPAEIARKFKKLIPMSQPAPELVQRTLPLLGHEAVGGCRVAMWQWWVWVVWVLMRPKCLHARP